MEADSLFRFNEKICLVQITDGNRGVLVDPLEEDLTALSQILLSRSVWMHGADYDMALMKRDWGGVPKRIWDTQIGARLIGCRKFGYANLVKEFFNVVLSKGSQKADWGQRPLPDRMAQYALNDVKFLIPLANLIQEKLKAKNRFEWFVESCERERTRGMERSLEKKDAWRIKGSGKFDEKTLAYLKGVWTWRETEAANWDRPSFMVAGNKDLISWSLSSAAGQPIQPSRSMRGDRRRRLFDSIKAVSKLSRSEWPEKIQTPRRERDREKEKVVDKLIHHRQEKAEMLDLEASVLGSRASLEAYVSGDDSTLMNWQKDVLELT